VTESLAALGRLRAIVFDAKDYRSLATFWTSLLGLEIDKDWPEWIETKPNAAGLQLAFQPAKRPLAVGAVSLDLEVPDFDAAQAHAESLGASLVEVGRYTPDEEHRIMADPEGNRFTLVSPEPYEYDGTTPVNADGGSDS